MIVEDRHVMLGVWLWILGSVLMLGVNVRFVFQIAPGLQLCTCQGDQVGPDIQLTGLAPNKLYA